MALHLRTAAAALLFIGTSASDVGGIACQTAKALSCVPDTDNSNFYCSDRYVFQWSNTSASTPVGLSDMGVVTMDTYAVSSISQTQILIMGGCDAPQQNVTSALGGCNDLSKATYSFNPNTNQFTKLEDMVEGNYRMSAVNSSQYVYLFGGRDVEDNLLCSIRYFDLVGNRWWSLLNTWSEGCSSDGAGWSADPDVVYLAGGYNEDYSISYNTTWKVTIDRPQATATFEPMAPMNQGRGDFLCSHVPGTEYAYCMGGFSTDDGFAYALSSTERYNMATNTWDVLSPMNVGRADFALGYLEGRLMAVGGQNATATPDNTNIVDKTVSWYQIESDCWINSAAVFDIPYDRFRYFGATYREANRFYIFGGQSDVEDSTSGVQVYKIESQVLYYQESLVDQASAATLSYHFSTAGYIVAALAATFVYRATCSTVAL